MRKQLPMCLPEWAGFYFQLGTAVLGAQLTGKEPSVSQVGLSDRFRAGFPCHGPVTPMGVGAELTYEGLSV